MVHCVEEALSGQEGNYVFPFFWLRGEAHQILKEYVHKIAESGCRAFCVESRPHPDFCGPGWWKDMEIILDEAEKENMKVWILDDRHFPTGYANGAVVQASTELKKQYLGVLRNDLCGPVPQVTLNLEEILSFQSGRQIEAENIEGCLEEEILAIIAGRVSNDDRMDLLVNLTDHQKNGILCWDVPEGYWKVFVLYLTRNGEGRDDYINVLDRDSCRLLVDAVYEPHYQHFGDRFGKTLAGFFSDEPLVGNTATFLFDESIGRKRMMLPWCKDMPALLEKRLGADWKKYLPLLWEKSHNAGIQAKTRQAYMDSVTNQIADSFSMQIGEWCRCHGVEYIGHIIEDNDQHARLGCSMGHYFRAMKGQDMAGIDNIGGQLFPGGEDVMRVPLAGTQGDGEFYHFMLGKLASSCAHIDPKKKGRAMCENFGAYGWGLGVRDMKYLADHFLVNGINRFVPHAFSAAPYPDKDCPPHFYAHGNNPQYPYFATLMNYMNRICHILENSIHCAPVALLYHGEAEWAGDYMPDKKVARTLLEHQIDFDILPADLFSDFVGYEAYFDGALHVGREKYQALVIPYSQFLVRSVARFIQEALAVGFPVFIIDELPQGISDILETEEEQRLLAGIQNCPIVNLDQLPTELKKDISCDLWTGAACTKLRYYHGNLGQSEIYLLMNEDPWKAIEEPVCVPVVGEAYYYDAYQNKAEPCPCGKVDEGMQVPLFLEPLELKILIVDTHKQMLSGNYPVVRTELKEIKEKWQVSIARSAEYPCFHDEFSADGLQSIGMLYPDFSGIIRYEVCLQLSEKEAAADEIKIADAYEGTTVWLNGICLGKRISKPYRFETKGLWQTGENHLRIEVATTLARENHTTIERTTKGNRGATKFMMPTGIIGPVFLVYHE